MIKITSTKDIKTEGIKLLVYGPAGAGKTFMCSTAPTPIIISAESGLLSLKNMDIPTIEVDNLGEVLECYKWAVGSEEARNYETLCLDSLSEIAEVMLSQYKKEEKDARKAYGRLSDDMTGMIRGFRDIKGMNVYFTAKQLKIVNDLEVTTFAPTMPGKTLLNALPYFFDEVFPIRIGKLEDGSIYRYLQTTPDMRYDAKDRSGNLEAKEKPDLTTLFEKIYSSN